MAVDVDGTLADYHQALTDFSSKYFDLPELEEQWDGRGEMEDFLGIDKGQWRDLKFAYRSGGFKRFAKPFPGGVEFTEYAVRLGCEVWITTTRPWLRLDSIDPDTRWWLEHNAISYDHLLYDEHKYPLLARLVDRDRVVMVVDDLGDMLDEVTETFGSGVGHMVARPHNVCSIPRPRFNFEELQDILYRKVEQWQTS